MDAADELLVLCAAHEHGLEVGYAPMVKLHVVFDADARLVVHKAATREGAVAWLAERVFKPRPFGQIAWD